MKIRNIPLAKLVPSANNVRKTGAHIGIDELAASISAHGLLQNLQVRETKGGKYEVVAGGRRLAALRQLAKRKAIAKAYEVPCHVLGDEDAAEISLAENVVRLQMHPADQYDAFKALADEGKGPEEIAARFGYTATFVKQRLKLASVSPKLLDAYRAEEMTLDQLMAFTVSDDHAAQEAAWFEQPDWNRNTANIRRALTAAHVEADDPRVVFIGIEAYTKAGGNVLRDLFDTGHQGYLTDVALLDRLVRDRLQAEAAKLHAEGWKWVEIVPDLDHTTTKGMGRIDAEKLPIPEERQEEYARLTDEYNDLIDEHGEESPEIIERLNTLFERIDELSMPEERFQPADMARAGAFIGIDPGGRVAILRGLVRPGDEIDSEEEATPDSSVKAAPKLLSDKLVEELTAHRTAALRALLSGNSDIALTAVVHALAFPLFYDPFDTASCLGLRVDSASLRSSAEGIDETAASVALSERFADWQSRLPKEAEGLWPWLSTQSIGVRLDLLAFCAGCSVNALKKPHDREDGGRLAHADCLAGALGLDMAQWWQPTAANYLARVSKSHILEAVAEAVSPSAAENLGTMKKDALVAEAERRLSGTGWLPPVLRASQALRTDATLADAAE